MFVNVCEQGSPEWHRARAGIVTASMFATARKRVGELDDRQKAYVDACLAGMSEKEAAVQAGYKAAPRSDIVMRALAGEPVGDWSEEAKNYAFRLAIERISGEPLDEAYETYSMKRGHELEPAARAEHQRQSGLIVERAGFVSSGDGFGCSADGLIGKDGGAEYKCFMDPAKLRAFHIDNDASDVFEQAQGCMWITGRKYWHIGLYCPSLKSVGKQLWWKSFDRDEAFIDAMRADLIRFRELVDEYERRLYEQPESHIKLDW